jgi:hypothetical protein
VLARGEDIAIAESELKASQAELQTALDPPREVVQSARLGIAVVDESVREMKALREACGDFRGETTIEDSDADDSDNDGDNNNDNEGLDLTLDTRFKCPDDLKDVYEAIAEGLEGSRLVPVAALSLLTEVATNEKLQVLVAGLKAKVVEAEQYLAKVRTGGAVDATTLDRDVAAARGVLECRQAVLAGANAGELFRQESPFAWTDPDPCALRQLPGKLPPFSELDVRISSRSARTARIEE